MNFGVDSRNGTIIVNSMKTSELDRRLRELADAFVGDTALTLYHDDALTYFRAAARLGAELEREEIAQMARKYNRDLRLDEAIRSRGK